MLQESSWTIFFRLTSPINRRSSSFSSTSFRRGLNPPSTSPLMDDLGDPTIELSLSFYSRNHPGSPFHLILPFITRPQPQMETDFIAMDGRITLFTDSLQTSFYLFWIFKMFSSVKC